MNNKYEFDINKTGAGYSVFPKYNKTLFGLRNNEQLADSNFKVVKGKSTKVNAQATYHLFNSKFHHESEPAVFDRNGNKFWFKHGKLHRLNGPAAVYANGDWFWYCNGELHRTNGPAKFANNRRTWYMNNKRVNVTRFLKQRNYSLDHLNAIEEADLVLNLTM